MKERKSTTYTEKIRWRNRALWLLLALMLAFMVVVGETGGGDSQMMTDLANLTYRVIYFGGMIWVGVRIHHNKALLKNRLLLEEKMLEEQDERRQYLHDKSGGLVVDVLLLFLLFTTTATALYNMPAFYMSLAALAATVLLKAGAYLAYSRL